MHKKGGDPRTLASRRHWLRQVVAATARLVFLSGSMIMFQGNFEGSPSLPFFLHEPEACTAWFVDVLVCRNSSMCKLRYCTFLHSVQRTLSVPRNIQLISVVELKSSPCVLCHYGQGSTASCQFSLVGFEEDSGSELVFWLNARHTHDHSLRPVPFADAELYWHTSWSITVTFFRTANRHVLLVIVASR